MTTYDLMLKVKNELEAKGFETTSPKFSNCLDYEVQAQATKDGKSERRPVKGYNFTHLYGYTISFEVVYRSNATSENVSVDISICEWEASSGKRIAKERINTKMSDKSIKNRINKIVEMYEAL
jgi:hypothetical protein